MLLRRLAAARFGVATADRPVNALAAEANPERLAEVGEEIVRRTTGDEPLRKIGVSTWPVGGRHDDGDRRLPLGELCSVPGSPTGASRHWFNGSEAFMNVVAVSVALPMALAT